MKAVHLGQPGIGSDAATLLDEAGYELIDVVVDETFAEVTRASDDYIVREISTADIVTVAVGSDAHEVVAGALARGIERRIESEYGLESDRLMVLVRSADRGGAELLEAEVRIALPESDADSLESVAIFARTGVDSADWIDDLATLTERR